MVTDTRPGKNGASPVATARRGRLAANTEGAPKREDKSKTSTKSSKGIVTAKAYCVSRTAIMFDPMLEETLDGLATGVHPQIKKDTPHREVAAAKILKNEAGDIIIPIDNLFACLVEAGRRVKFDGKSKISTATSTTLPEYFWLQDEDLVFLGADGKPLEDNERTWIVDKRRGRLKDGTAVAIRRPKFPVWGFEVRFEYDENTIAKEKLQELFRVAGASMGLCSFRPNKKGRFGTFEVQRWTTENRRPVVRVFEEIDLTAEQAA